MPEVSSIGLGHGSKREGGGMTLIPVESSHLAAIGYEPDCMRLTIQFVNADIYEYNFVEQELHDYLMADSSPGSFFNQHIKPNFPGDKIHTGTLAERSEIWLRSEDAAEFKGSAVALQMGRPVSVCAWMELEKIADLRALYDGDKSVVIVEVPNAVEARVE